MRSHRYGTTSATRHRVCERVPSRTSSRDCTDDANVATLSLEVKLDRLLVVPLDDPPLEPNGFVDAGDIGRNGVSNRSPRNGGVVGAAMLEVAVVCVVDVELLLLLLLLLLPDDARRLKFG